MGKNRNKRKNKKKKNPQLKGILMTIEGKLQPVGFNVPCDFCERIEEFPIRVPKPTGWQWTHDGQISFDVFYCCTRQSCVESGTNQYREALKTGIIVEGEPPENLFPTEQEE